MVREAIHAAAVKCVSIGEFLPSERRPSSTAVTYCPDRCGHERTTGPLTVTFYNAGGPPLKTHGFVHLRDKGVALRWVGLHDDDRFKFQILFAHELFEQHTQHLCGMFAPLRIIPGQADIARERLVQGVPIDLLFPYFFFQHDGDVQRAEGR